VRGQRHAPAGVLFKSVRELFEQKTGQRSFIATTLRAGGFGESNSGGDDIFRTRQVRVLGPTQTPVKWTQDLFSPR
jgi:hypothetical protein